MLPCTDCRPLILDHLYGLLDAQSPVALGLPLLALGAATATVGLWLGGRRSTRSRYRPDPWRLPEWLVSACGVTAAATAVIASSVKRGLFRRKSFSARSSREAKAPVR